MQTASDFEMKKIGLLVKKFLFRVFTTGIRASREMFWGKMISLSKKFTFSVIISGVWVTSLSFLQISLVRCVKPPIIVRREKIGKINLEKLFFGPVLDFEEEKAWTFCKTVRHDSQNRSLPVQMTIFRNFSGSKFFCMNVVGQGTETSDFRRKCFLRVVRGAFRVSSAILWEKHDESKFYILCLV